MFASSHNGLVRQNKGFVHILIILLVLAVSGAIVFFVTRNERLAKAASPIPLGNLTVNPTSGFNGGSFTLTATGVEGANGVQVDNVRYYLLNPQLAVGNNWGKADWCANSNYTQPAAPTYDDLNNNCGTFTYDISESSNPGNNYQIVWDKNTHSSGSTPYSRALTATNIPAGTYTVGLRVQDVNGNVNGGASQLKVTISDGSTPTPPPTPMPTPTPAPGLGLSFSTTYFGLKMAAGGVGKKAIYLTSTGATRFSLYAPTSSLGITFSPSEGSIAPGETIPIYVKAGAGQPFGIYKGKVYAASSLTNAQTDTGVSDSITIEPATYDSDVDGFTNAAENVMGVDPNYSCRTPFGINAWPPDLNGDGTVTYAESQLVFQAYANKNYNARYDMDGNGVISAQDAQKVHSYIGKTCQ